MEYIISVFPSYQDISIDNYQYKETFNTDNSAIATTRAIRKFKLYTHETYFILCYKKI